MLRGDLVTSITRLNGRFNETEPVIDAEVVGLVWWKRSRVDAQRNGFVLLVA